MMRPHFRKTRSLLALYPADEPLHQRALIAEATNERRRCASDLIRDQGKGQARIADLADNAGHGQIDVLVLEGTWPPDFTNWLLNRDHRCHRASPAQTHLQSRLINGPPQYAP